MKSRVNVSTFKPAVKVIPSAPAQLPVKNKIAVTVVNPKPNPFIKPEEDKPKQKEVIVERPQPKPITIPRSRAISKNPFQPKPINVVMPAPKPAPKPKPVQDSRPMPPTSIRRPKAIPTSPIRRSPIRVSRPSPSRRVSFRAARLNITKPTVKQPAWTPYPPTSRSFMPRVKPGQYSLSPKSNSTFLAKKQAAEINRLKKQVNTLNQDALKTKEEFAIERAMHAQELEQYTNSPFFRATNSVSKNTKGVMEVFDSGAKLLTPSVNGIGAIGMNEGASKLAAAGMGLFAFLFLIGRVE